MVSVLKGWTIVADRGITKLRALLAGLIAGMIPFILK